MVVKGPAVQAGSRLFHDTCGSRATSQLISGVLAAVFLLASLVALYEVTQIPLSSSESAHSSKSIQTIRAFYAALNEYMETGDATPVSQTLAPGALAFVPERGAMGDDSQLMTYLIALRSTYPELRFSVERIDAGHDIAIASVRRMDASDASATSQEFFRVRDSRIVQHWTTVPKSALLHPLTVPPMTETIIQSGHLAIAEITLAPDEDALHPIDGPALALVQSGRLTLSGDSFSQILDIATGATVVPGLNESAFAEPGQAISIPTYRAHVRNDGASAAVVRIATLVEDRQVHLIGYPGDRPLPPPALNDASMMGSPRTTAYGSATIRPLAFDERSIPAGTWELEVAWAVLGPGALLPLATDGGRAMAHVLSGSTSHLQNTLTNISGEPILALVIRLRTHHAETV